MRVAPPASVAHLAVQASVLDSILTKRLDRVTQALEAARGRMRHMERSNARQSSQYLTSFSGLCRGMLSTLGIKPYHLPILIAMSLVLLRHSDARVPKKPHPIADRVRLLHKRKSLPPPIPPPAVSREELLGFSKRVYKEAWRANATLVTADFQKEFDILNESTDGNLGKTLTAVFELRLIELQYSVRHARAMLDMVNHLIGQPTADCLSCNPETQNQTSI